MNKENEKLKMKSKIKNAQLKILNLRDEELNIFYS